MTPGLEDKLFKDFNDLFSEQIPIECEDGWEPLIRGLLTDILNIGRCTILQIKEKFGGLRVYVFECTTDIDNIITEYESKSYHICEICGKEGKVNTSSWIRTLCKAHAT